MKNENFEALRTFNKRGVVNLIVFGICFVICFMISTIITFHVKEIKKKLENKEKECSALKKDLFNAINAENNMDIIKFPNGKYYAVVNIHNIKGRQLLDEFNFKEEDKYTLFYRRNEKFPEMEILSIASGERMLVFPVPEERKRDFSFWVNKFFTYKGNEYISSDLFHTTRMGYEKEREEEVIKKEK